jgi:probable F420-dependent oxidoreductase
MSDMRLGVVFPTCEIGDDPVAVRDFAQAAEDLGYDHLVAYDHVVGAEHANREPPLGGPYTEHDPFHEPFVLFGFLAGVTRRLELTTGVIILPQRQTVLVAKQAAEIAVLSGGRLRLGVGTGWNFVEYDSLGVPFGGRGARLAEQVEVMRQLWRQPLVDFEGRFHRIDRAGILPRPPADIPVWFGGSSPQALARAVRLGDGFLFGSSGRRIVGLVHQTHEMLAAAGRDPSTFGFEALVDWSKGPEAWVGELQQWREVGGTHFSIRTMSTAASFMRVDPPGFTTVGEHIAALETFMNTVRS